MPKRILKNTVCNPESDPEKNNEIDNRNTNMPHSNPPMPLVDKPTVTASKKVRFMLRDSRRKETDNNDLRIIYANGNGIAGKTESLKNALETYQEQIATILEIKIEINPTNRMIQMDNEKQAHKGQRRPCNPR